MIKIVPALSGTSTFDACMAIRLDVFVNEQNVPREEELDTLDNTAIHILALVDGLPAGTARAVEKAPGLWKIGRVAVRAMYRKRGIGTALMREIEAACPARDFILSAQTQVLLFYERLGYVKAGPEFMEAGIPHYLMRKTESVL